MIYSIPVYLDFQRLWSYDHMALYKCVYYYYYCTKFGDLSFSRSNLWVLTSSICSPPIAPDPPSGANSHIPDARSSPSALSRTSYSTTVMQYWSSSQSTWCADCSRCSMRRHDSSTTCDHTTTSPMRWRHYTGCESQNACSTRSRC